MPSSKPTHYLPSDAPSPILREDGIETAFIEKLRSLKYEYRPDITDRAALEQNFREKFEALNRVRLTDAEFARLVDEIITPDVFTASKTLRSINSFTRDDGTPLNYSLVNLKDWCKNHFEVVNQLRIKLKALVKLLTKDAVLKKHKVIIFTEFMTTARYLKKQLQAAGIKGMDEIDSASKRDRANVIQEFAPYYNESTSPKLAADGREEIRVLVSTDVLSEGLNLQDATRLINYDLNWNPVRLMQRIGRVDRRMNPAVEKHLMADHPEQAALRGKVAYWNFLPPDDLENLLRLYSRVAFKTLRISKVFGIEGKQLLKPDDDFDALRDFTHAYEGEASPAEQLHLEYQKLIRDNPALEPFLNSAPLRLFSGKEHIKPDTRAVFFCYRLPAEDKTVPPEQAWEGEAGRTGWYLYDIARDQIAEDAPRTAEVIRSTLETPRRLAMEPAALRDLRLKVEKHIKNTYLKQVQAPVGVNPVLKCWMELN